jgi:hypothetical protein
MICTFCGKHIEWSECLMWLHRPCCTECFKEQVRKYEEEKKNDKST